MSSILDIEKSAAKLRRHLNSALSPELQLLCGMRFFEKHFANEIAHSESYIREFIPLLARSAEKVNPREFLPQEVQSLDRLIDLARQSAGTAESADLDKLAIIISGYNSSGGDVLPCEGVGAGRICVHCLFVEYNPDLDLSPRGRILPLEVKATLISDKADDDDVVVRNPVDDPDDRFLTQARDSVRAARKYLHTRYGLSLDKRYRLDYIFSSHHVYFAGDSLGVAFAIGALAAISEIEIFREKLSIPSTVAFSGALSAEGELANVDEDALKLKIFRAFHSGIEFVVIPRTHLTTAWEYLSELEREYPGRKLELVGADTLAAIADDPRLVTADKSSIPAYIGRKAWRARRTIWVEAPALSILAAILFVLIAPTRWMPWFDDNPSYAFSNTIDNSLDVYNRDSTLIWSDTMSCPFSHIMAQKPAEFAKVSDLDNDGRNEVVFLPRIESDCEERSWLRFYSYNGILKAKRFGPILNKYPGDTSGILYDEGGLFLVDDGDEKVLVSIMLQELPARSHIRIWSGEGDSLGWYINRGHCALRAAVDLDSDGHKELLFLGYNNSMGCVALLALKVDAAKGFSPIRGAEKFDEKWYIPGTQYGYVLFPVTDIGQIPGELQFGYNQPSPLGIRITENDLIKVFITESDFGCMTRDIIYFLDHNLRVVRVAYTDGLSTRRRQLVSEEKLPAVRDWSAYESNLIDAIMYWTDSGWVTSR